MLQSIFSTRNRVFILFGVIVFVFSYYIMLFINERTIEQGIVDWGIDQGFTMLFWGILLVAICLFFIIYPNQNIFRDRNITRTHAVIFGSVIFFAVVGASFFSWITHDPTLNFFHNPYWDNFPVDKITHFFWSFALTLTVLTIRPRKAYAIILWCVFALYELFEVVVIYNFGDTNFNNVFTLEMADIPLDLIFNTIGWLSAIFVAVVIFKREFRR